MTEDASVRIDQTVRLCWHMHEHKASGPALLQELQQSLYDVGRKLASVYGACSIEIDCGTPPDEDEDGGGGRDDCEHRACECDEHDEDERGFRPELN